MDFAGGRVDTKLYATYTVKMKGTRTKILQIGGNEAMPYLSYVFDV
jgi:hypothetical protein